MVTPFAGSGGEAAVEPESEASRAAYDEVAAELVATARVTSGHMFGMPCLKVGGKTVAAYRKGAMVFKLRGAVHADALALPGARLFRHLWSGRVMKEWVEVPASSADTWARFAREAVRTGLGPAQ